MNSPEYFLITLGVLFIIVSVYKAITWNGSFRACRKNKNQFRLFAVRDELIYLVASDKIEEDSWIFQTFYESLNRIINIQHKYNFTNLIKAMRDETSPADLEKFVEMLTKEIDKSPKEVTKIIVNYYEAMVNITLDNSLFIRFLFKHGSWAFKLLHSLKKSKQCKLFTPQRYAYETYSSSKDILAALST